ncbi:MAG TPA: F0F1 ATP synthase subunit delta [Streptosporangiaceae bacterium]
MRGASRASLAQAGEQLSAVAQGRPAAKIGDELFAVVALLDSEHGLRRLLSDPARPAAAKAQMIRGLLDGKVTTATLDLVAWLVSARWSVPRDLGDATEELGVLAFVIAAERAGQLDDTEDDLFRFGRVVAGQPKLRTALSDPALPATRKRELLGALLDGKVSASAERLITLAVMQPRGRSLDANLETYARLTAERRERLVALVRVASPLSQQQQRRLTAALAGLYGHEIHLNVLLDPHVVGGMSVQVGDELIDASVASRLAALRRRLAG